MVYISFICCVIPLMLMTLLLKGESKTTIGFMIIGLFICLTSYEVNSFLLSYLHVDTYTLTTTFAPIVEEILKALPVLFFAIVISDKTNRIFPVAMAVGVGFALLENVYSITQNIETISIAWAIVRGFGSGLMHGITTAAVGYGFSFIYKKKEFFYLSTFGLLSVAIIYHSIYNTLVQSRAGLLGYLLPIATYVLVFVLLNKREIFKKRVHPSQAT